MTRVFTVLNPSRTWRWSALSVLAVCLVFLGGCKQNEVSNKAQLPASPGPAVAASQANAPPSPSPGAGGAPPAAEQPETATATSEAPPSSSAEGAEKAGEPPSLAAFTGRSEPHRRSVLTPRMPGVILTMHVRDGDVVDAGQTLVTFDTSDYKLRIRAAEAALSTANAQKKALETEWTRVKGLAAGGAVPESQFEQLDGQLGVASAGIAQARIGVEMARKALADATVVAPYRSVVIAKMATEGEYAAAMPPTPLVRLEEIDPLDVRIGIPEGSLRDAQVGDCLEVTFPALGVVRTARINQVVPSVNPMTRTFTVIGSIANPDHGLPPGLFAKARLVGESECPAEAAKNGDAP